MRLNFTPNDLPDTTMKNLFAWLKLKLKPGGLDDDPYSRRPALRVSAIPKPKKRPAPPKKAKIPEILGDFEYSSESPGRIDDGGPGKNVLIRSQYLREDSGTHESLKILDESTEKTENSVEFDPYNTGRFDRSKSWDTPSRKK